VAPLRLRGAVVGLALIAALAWLVPWLTFRIPRLTSSGSNIAWGQVPSGPSSCWCWWPGCCGRCSTWGAVAVAPADGLLAYAILLPAVIFASVGGLYYIFALPGPPPPSTRQAARRVGRRRCCPICPVGCCRTAAGSRG